MNRTDRKHLVETLVHLVRADRSDADLADQEAGSCW